MGDFNLDATGGAMTDWAAIADPVKLQEKAAQLKGQEAIVNDLLRPDQNFPQHDRLVPFEDSPQGNGYAPTNRPAFYQSDFLPRAGLSDEAWESKLGLTHGEQTDNVFYAPGLLNRREISPVRRLQWFVDYAHGQRQLSDHFGIRCY